MSSLGLRGAGASQRDAQPLSDRTGAAGMMARFRLPAGGMILNMSQLMVGKLAAFVITLATAPLISRLFTPADFGVAAYFASIATVLVVVATLRYDMAIVLPKEAHKARGLVVGGAWVTLALSLLILALAGLVNVLAPHLTAVERLGNLGYLIAAAVLLLGLGRLAEGWLLRTESYTRMAVSDVAQAGVTNGFRVAAGALAGSSVGALVAGFFLGIAMRLAVLVSGRGAGELAATPIEEPLRATLTEYADFPRYNAPAGLLRGLATNLPVLAMSAIYPASVVGLYAIASGLVLKPMEIILQAFRRVFLRRAAQMLQDEEPLRGMFVRSVLVLGGLGVVPSLVLFFAGEPMMALFLGEDWRDAGRYAEILSPMVAAGWLVSPAAMMLIVLRRQRIWLRTQAVLVVLQFAVFLGAWRFDWPVERALYFFVAVTIGVNLVVIAAVFRSLARRGETMP